MQQLTKCSSDGAWKIAMSYIMLRLGNSKSHGCCTVAFIVYVDVGWLARLGGSGSDSGGVCRD